MSCTGTRTSVTSLPAARMGRRAHVGSGELGGAWLWVDGRGGRPIFPARALEHGKIGAWDRFCAFVYRVLFGAGGEDDLRRDGSGYGVKWAGNGVHSGHWCTCAPLDLLPST